MADLYRRLDALRSSTRTELGATRLSRAGGSPQAQSERDAFASRYERRLAQLESVDDGLAFGRLDLAAESERLYIGRLGLSDEAQQTLLVDWRAPAAAAFYRATAARPHGVVRRRHLRARGRRVLGYDDEVFDVSELSTTERHQLQGEAALLATLQEERTGRMRDVVATLQAEQDEVVRADRAGILVVQGGPGTGKTVVALHRAAYLLYTYRDQLASAGVLVVGPGSVFLRYVEAVLPSLGETAVVLATEGELFPGIEVSGVDPIAVAQVKGSAQMVAAMRAAIRDRQQRADRDLTFVHEGRRLRLDRRVVRGAVESAQRSGRNHNPARNIFVRQVLTSLARQVVGREAWESYERSDRDEVLLDLIRVPEIRSTLNAFWPHLTAPALLREWYAVPGRRRGSGLSAADSELLQRSAGAGWTKADVPLLDEIAELLGSTDPWARRRERGEEADRRRGLSYAEDALRSSGAGGGLVDAATLAGRYAAPSAVKDLPERALADRTWAFGHVVVDEAQELSAMAWRLLLRRCPSGSMTVVGDVAQAGTPWAARSWAEVLDEHAPGGWRVVELTVGYRTPAPVMALAADVLAAISPELRAPRAVRAGTAEPVALQTPDLVAGAVRAASGLTGRVGVLVPDTLLAPVLGALRDALPAETGTTTDARIGVFTVAQSKGLEFDGVVVVDPQGILDASVRGEGDLYVALTRTTDRLVVVHAGPLPEVLRRLAGSPVS